MTHQSAVLLYSLVPEYQNVINGKYTWKFHFVVVTGIIT
jgi:hypothetical protein